VTVISAPVHKLPMVTVVALVDAGAARDPVGRDGLAALTAKLLLEGTAQRDGAALIDAFERLGASVEAGAGWDTAVVQLTALRTNVQASMDLLREVLRAPAFPEREVLRLKAERQAERLQVRTEPRELADESFERFLYAADSRYGLPEGGRTASIGAITRDDITSFYRGMYVPQGLTVIVAGDMTADESVALVTRAVGDWTGTPAQTPPINDAPRRATRHVQVVAKDDAPQSELRIGHRGVPRGHPDYFKLVVMNAVLGGLFSSRINLNLRERHGYAYGAHSSFEWRRGSGPFVVSTAVESGVTADATREVLLEIERMRAEPITADELSLATSYLAGVFPIRYETTAAIANALTALAAYGYPDDYFDTYRDKITSVTTAEVLAMARAHLHPDELLVLAVGDPNVVTDPLAKLGLGPVNVIAADDMEQGL
jgi:zinc protease